MFGRARREHVTVPLVFRDVNAFHVLGGVLAIWALLVSFLGVTRENFPATKGSERMVAAISVMLVVSGDRRRHHHLRQRGRGRGGGRRARGPRAPVADPLAIDDGTAVHYTAVERGTPVYASDETQVGTVLEVLDNYQEHIFDGLVVEIGGGDLRFVDAPEVARTAERGVTLTIDPAAVAAAAAAREGPACVHSRAAAGGCRGCSAAAGRRASRLLLDRVEHLLARLLDVRPALRRALAVDEVLDVAVEERDQPRSAPSNWRTSRSSYSIDGKRAHLARPTGGAPGASWATSGSSSALARSRSSSPIARLRS